MRVQSLGWDDTLEESRTTLSSILAWRIPWTGEPGGLQPMGSQRIGHDLAPSTHFTAMLLLRHKHSKNKNLKSKAVVRVDGYKHQDFPMHLSFSVLKMYLFSFI